MNFDDLTAADPRLLELERRIIRHAEHYEILEPDTRYCANAAWYGYGPFTAMGFKAELLHLVGYLRTDLDALASSEAYDVAYRHLYDLLPSCRGCGCLPATVAELDGVL